MAVMLASPMPPKVDGPWIMAFFMSAYGKPKNAMMFKCEKLTRPATTALHFVGDPNHIAVVTQGPQPFPESLIADEICILDCEKAKKQLGWTPLHTDSDMLIAAYRSRHAKKDAEDLGLAGGTNTPKAEHLSGG